MSIDVRDFGALGGGAVETAQIKNAISAAQTAKAKLVFPRGRYVFDEPLSISGIDVDFEKSELVYAGAPGEFALTLNSDAGYGTVQRCGNRFADFTLIQENWSEPDVCEAVVIFDPPSIPAWTNVSSIETDMSGGLSSVISTVISVIGAQQGGLVFVEFDNIVDGITVCGRVTANDEVTVYFNSYKTGATDMPEGELFLKVVNNAYHGLCIGGGQGRLDNVKVTGFSGVSVGVGAKLCNFTGVDFPANTEAYYWKVSGNISVAAGYGLVVQPRNNENEFSFEFFNLDAYGDTTPRRHPYISAVVMSGSSNTIPKMSIEGSCSGPALVITDACNSLTTLAPIYWEHNSSWMPSSAPLIDAAEWSSNCSIRLRAAGRPVDTVHDRGLANNIEVVTGSRLNGGALLTYVSHKNIVENGDFSLDQQSWDLWGTNGSIAFLSGALFGGKIARVEVQNGIGVLAQNIHLSSGFGGRTGTSGAWVRTNIPGVYSRLNYQPGSSCPDDGLWHYINSVAILSGGTVQMAIKHDNAATGYFEVCNVTAVLGTKPLAY